MKAWLLNETLLSTVDVETDALEGVTACQIHIAIFCFVLRQDGADPTRRRRGANMQEVWPPVSWLDLCIMASG